uniref:Putative ovule protein n=1 Tax=Solanum chacoense TaxID=4108 RepID=A0A0V0GNN4_SOLCH
MKEYIKIFKDNFVWLLAREDTTIFMKERVHLSYWQIVLYEYVLNRCFICFVLIYKYAFSNQLLSYY